MIPRTQAIVFSKDRALQLDATLASFFLHCTDSADVPVTVLCKASTNLHVRQYQTLQAQYPHVTFVAESSFKKQLLDSLTSEFVLFLVDDNIFVRSFTMKEVVTSIDANQSILGFSLRLGKNTNFCYSLNQKQSLPAFSQLRFGGKATTSQAALAFRWVGASCDFGYPLEVSSSVYRISDLRPVLEEIAFHHPNTLEAHLSEQVSRFAESKPALLCFDNSVTFCNPINKVQTHAPDNRAGVEISYNSEELAALYEIGARIDVQSYSGYTPRAAHEEVELRTCAGQCPQIKAPPATITTVPLISVIIPCYNQAHLLSDAVASVVAQTYQNWQMFIVNDGSPDNTSAVANRLISQYRDRKIVLIEKENEGLAEARNTGIRACASEWILPLDSDDMFAPTFMEKTMARALAEPEVNHVSAYVQEFGARSDMLIVFPYDPNQILENNLSPYASLHKRELWEKVGGYKPIIPFGAEDWNYWVACSKLLNPRRVEEPLFLYRKHTGASMVDAVIAHGEEVAACLHTCHQDLYDPMRLIKDHETLGRMHSDTRAAIDKHIAKFPQYSQLYLWRGLDNEAHGHWRQAIRDFQTSCKLGDPKDWQAWFRLALICSENGLLELAAQAARETLTRLPRFPLRELLGKVVEAHPC